MKDNIIGIVYFGLLFFSIYLSVITDFPYFIYFFLIITPVFAFTLIYFMNILDRKKMENENKEYKKQQQERALINELDKKRKQEEWDNLPTIEKDRILEENKKLEKEKTLKLENEYKEQQVKNKRAEKLAEENRLRDLKIKEENEKNEKESQLILAKEAEANEKEKEENRLKKIQEQREKRERELKEEIKRKILENERRKQLASEAIQELLDAGLIDNNYYSGKSIRESIPTEVKIGVWHRDKERCVSCSSKLNLEFDHIIPVSKGGANSIKNIQLLCRNCNRAKSNKII